VDFDRRILYYSHSEFGKKVSMYTPFCDILHVERLKSSGSHLDEDAEERLPRSCCRCLPRIAKADHRSFALYTKAKNIELRCSSQGGSEKWIAIIQTAISVGRAKQCNDEVDSEQSTQSCSRESSMSSCTANGSEQSEDENPGEEGTEQCNGATHSPLCKVHETSIAAPGRCLTLSSSSDSPLPQLSPDALPPPPLPCDGSYHSSADMDLVGSPFVSAKSNTSNVSSNMKQAPPAGAIDAELGAKDDLQSLLIDAVLSSSATSTSHNAWKRPQQPSVEKPVQPSLHSPFEDCKAPLPTIEEESVPEADAEMDAPQTGAKSYEIMQVSLRERIVARGVKIPRDIEIP
jgi:ubiquitin